MAALLKIIGSWRTTLGVASALMAPYVWASIFGEGAFDRWLHFTFHTIAGHALYFLLILNIAANGIRETAKKFSPVSSIADDVRGMDICSELSVSDKTSAQVLIGWIRGKGLDPKPGPGDKSITAVSGRLSFLPGVILRLGLAVFFVSLAFSQSLRQEAVISGHEGDSVEALGKGFTIGRIEADLPADFLQVGDKTIFMLKGIKARINSRDDGFAVGSGYPTRRAGLYWRVSHLGYYQPAIINGHESGLMLDVLAPGKSHAIKIDETGREIVFSLSPDKTISKGLLTGKLYNLKQPSYALSIKGNEKPKQLIIRPGEDGGIGGMRVRLGQPGLYVRVIVVKDPALMGVIAGLSITAIGIIAMLARFAWYERRIAVLYEGDKVVIGYSEEFYKKWGILKFRSWMEGLDPGG